jgi:DNA-binding transcriptional LysR family regulator
MEWDDLKHFLAVARHGSLTEAARELKSSAATVGRRVAALEEKLGARLFDRNQSGYTLTESGEAIRVKAEEVEEAVLAVEREAIGRDLHATGRVRLATTDDLAAFIVAPHLPRFHEEYPEITLEVVARHELANLTRRDADISLRSGRPQHGDYLIRRVGLIDFGLYGSKSYVAAHELVPEVCDLNDLDLITWAEEWSQLRGGPWLANHAPKARVVFMSNSPRVHYAACKVGLGVTIMPCVAGDADPDLVCLLPPERLFSPDIWLVVHRALARTARVRAVMDFLGTLGPALRRQACA